MSNHLIDRLRQEIEGGQVIAIVGAGVSIGATRNNPVASWVGLLRDGVKRCTDVVPGLRDHGWAERVLVEVESDDLDDLLAAATKVSSKLGSRGGEYGRWLRETVGALRALDTDVIKALQELAVPIATTNYDSLLEQVTTWPAVTWRQGPKVERVLRGDDPGVLHLHGHWDDPDSIVLDIRSYEKVLGDAHAQTMQQALRATRTLLFVGYGKGLADPNFSAFLRWSRQVFKRSEYSHFRLVLNADVADVQATHPAEERIDVLSFGEKHADLAPFLRDLRKAARPDGDAARRRKHRDKVVGALAEQLARLFEDPQNQPLELAAALKVEKAPGEPAKATRAIIDRLVDCDDSIPLLDRLIWKYANRKLRSAVEALENCMDLVLPFHFSPAAVQAVSDALNTKGGGFLKGVMMTKSGAELVMAAHDQSEAQFDRNDPKLRGRRAIERGVPSMGQISIDDEANRFLASVMGSDREEFRARNQRWDQLATDRTTYCIVELPETAAEHDYATKVLQRASLMQPDLPIFLLTKDSQFKDHEEQYLRVLRRRFFGDGR